MVKGKPSRHNFLQFSLGNPNPPLFNLVPKNLIMGNLCPDRQILSQYSSRIQVCKVTPRKREATQTPKNPK